jgi:hypothetical protein
VIGKDAGGFSIKQDFAHNYPLIVFAERVQHRANLGAGLLE